MVPRAGQNIIFNWRTSLLYNSHQASVVIRLTSRSQNDLFPLIMTYFIFSLLCLIWGSTWLAIKIGLQDSPPLWSAGFRFVIAALIILVINRIRNVTYPADLKRLWKIAFPGIFMYGLSYSLVYAAEVHISSSLTAVIFASFPFLIAIFSIFMLQEEKLSSRGWFGLAVGFLGIVVVFYDSLATSRFVFLGTVLAAFGAVASAYGTVYIRSRLQEEDIFVMSAVQMSLGAVIIILLAVLSEPLSDFKVTARSVGALSYLVVFGTVIAFLGYYYLLKKIQAIKVSQITYITPVIAVILGYIVLSERFTVSAALGAILVLFGVMLVVRR